MYPPMIACPPVPVLAILAGAVVLASVPRMAGCARSRAAPGAPVTASGMGRLTAIARRGTQRRPASAADDSGCDHMCQGPSCAAAAAAGARLRHFDDLNEAQIAHMLWCSAGSVTNQIWRGQARLREATGVPGEPGQGRTERRIPDERL